jgi:hypothetical protein
VAEEDEGARTEDEGDPLPGPLPFFFFAALTTMKSAKDGPDEKVIARHRSAEASPASGLGHPALYLCSRHLWLIPL